MPEKTFRFTFRSFVALMLFICLLGLPITALGMSFSEGHELANIEVKIEDDENIWQVLHVTFGIVFICCGLCHAFFNRRQLVNYFKGATGR